MTRCFRVKCLLIPNSSDKKPNCLTNWEMSPGNKAIWIKRSTFTNKLYRLTEHYCLCRLGTDLWQLKPALSGPTSTDPSLFVNRIEEVAELKLLLRSFLKNNDPDETTGVLVKGDSGVGKSIFSRKVVNDLKSEFSNKLIVLEVDGGKLVGVRGLLNKLCEVAQTEVAQLENTLLLRQAQMLAEISDYGKITVSQSRQITDTAGVAGEASSSFWGLLTAKFSLSATFAEANNRADGYEIPITDDYLSKLLNALIQEIGKAITVF